MPAEPFHILEIGLIKTGITDADLARYLPRLQQLYRLDIGNHLAITDASLPTLRQLTTVKHLSVSGTKLTSSACLELAKELPLDHIGVSTNQFSPELAEVVRTTPRLANFGLFRASSSVKTHDNQLQQLFSASHLRYLVLQDLAVDMTTWRELPNRLPNLSWLHVEGPNEYSKITDAHLAEFARCPKLWRLTVASKGITDSGLTSLAECRTLRELNVRNTSVTAAGIATLQAARPNLKIEWDAP